jgi:hypothetical protein
VILDSVYWVVQRSKHVRIDESRLKQVCARLDPSRLRLPNWQVPIVPPWRDDRLVDFVLLFNSINFCYWGEPKWTVTFRGKTYDGAYGMMAALTRALVDDDLPLYDGAFLADISPELCGHILRGNVPIPLEAGRLAIWHEVGQVLCRDFGGRWRHVVERAEGSALGLVELLVTHFASFEDTALYEGLRIVFRKRAQLAAGMIYQAFAGQEWGAFDDFEQLTVYADYKLPQILRKLEILVYDHELAALVDSQTAIPAGSHIEVEIRAATVWAGDLIRHELGHRRPGITATHVDFWLWETSQNKSPGDLPYHRTLTTAY